MKILQVLSTLVSGGAEHFAVELTNELIRQGHQCDLATLFDVEEGNALLKGLNPQCNHKSLGKKSALICAVIYGCINASERENMMWFMPMWARYHIFSFRRCFCVK